MFVHAIAANVVHPSGGHLVARRKEDFSEAGAVRKGEFRNFFNSGVAKVYTLKQSATVTRMRSYSSKMLWKSECSGSRRAKTARCQLIGPSLQC